VAAAATAKIRLVVCCPKWMCSNTLYRTQTHCASLSQIRGGESMRGVNRTGLGDGDANQQPASKSKTKSRRACTSNQEPGRQRHVFPA
jgi:hypothetical protein